jgi:iron complex outermembrane recepter protein
MFVAGLFSTAAFVPQASAQQGSEDKVKTLGTVTVSGTQPTSLPTQIPTTIEGITGKQVEETVNAVDAEDALKYFPSLNVRKRYIGDYDHAVLASRASGTGNSARSLVFADGILLSNLLGNGASYTPRWGLVTPEEIDRVDVLYGPFSAAYSGNSVGAVVDYVTRMPTQLEAHAKVSGFTQNFKLYGTDKRYSGNQESASLGNRNGDFSWWFNVNHLDSDSHPIGFATKLVSDGSGAAGGTPVTGAVLNASPKGQPWLVLGSTGQVHTVQDHAKLKLAYDFSPTVRASYVFGYWQNDVERSATSYLRDAAGNPVYSGNIRINGLRYTIAPTDMSVSKGDLQHFIHGLTVKSNTKSVWDWELAASFYDYHKDEVRSPTGALPSANAGGAGRITDLSGTGWNTFAARGTWRPGGMSGEHIVDFGLQHDTYYLRTDVWNTNDWISGGRTSRFSAFNGNTSLTSLYAQDTWRFAKNWRTTLGGRVERWHAWGGEVANSSSEQHLGSRNELTFSPKAALAYQMRDDWTLKGSLGRAIRNPSVAELYQGSISSGAIVNNDPNLKAERSWTSELTSEHDLGYGLVRATYFHEDTRDALYSQTNVTVSPTITNIQNVDHIRTNGLEFALQADDVLVRGLGVSASLTYARSTIVENEKFPASEGKWQPRVPRWRGTLLLSYKPSDVWTHTLGARYSGVQYNNLDNSDVNGHSYTGSSNFFVVDWRTRYRIAKQWTASVGVDNLNNQKYWAFHPYTQRTLMAELKYDL